MLFGGRHYLKNGTRLFVMQVGATVIGVIAMVIISMIDYEMCIRDRWYTDVVKKAELADYSGVKGCMVIRPYGYAIWENIQRIMDAEFKKLGHENVYMPMLIPESLLQREKDHVAGFAPECAWVTVGGQNTLPERLCVRPTSETLFCEHYRNVIHSYRDLPKLYNQSVSYTHLDVYKRQSLLRYRRMLIRRGLIPWRTKS